MERRYKRLLISDKFLMDMLKNCVLDKKEIPQDTELVGIYYDQSRQCFDIRIHSQEYPVLPEGGNIEVICPMFVTNTV